MSDEHDAEYEMVMPFIACQSKGGPYDDGAYVAGYEMGLLDARLSAMRKFGWTIDRRTIHASNQEQADLLALRYGFASKFVGVGDGWVDATFHKERSADV